MSGAINVGDWVFVRSEGKRTERADVAGERYLYIVTRVNAGPVRVASGDVLDVPTVEVKALEEDGKPYGRAERVQVGQVTRARSSNPTDKTKAKFARELHASQRKQRAAKLSAARAKAKTARAAAISSCKAGRIEAKTTCEKARVPARQARAERDRIAQENRELRAAEKARKGLRPLAKRTATEARQESDAEVRANLEASHPAYVGAFERIKRSVKADPRRSRTEAAIELIEQDPDLMRQVQEEQFDAGEAMMRKRYGNPGLTAAEVKRAMARRMNLQQKGAAYRVDVFDPNVIDPQGSGQWMTLRENLSAQDAARQAVYDARDYSRVSVAQVDKKTGNVIARADVRRENPTRQTNPKKWPMTMGGHYPTPAYRAGDVITNAPAGYIGARIVQDELPTPYTLNAQPGRAYLYRIDITGPNGDKIIDWIPEESVWEVKRGNRKVKGPYQPAWAKPRATNPKTSNGRDTLPKGKRAAYEAFHWGKRSTKEQNVKVPDPRSADLYALGEIVEIVYETTKGKERAEYEHKTRARPLLLCDAKDPHAFFIAVSPMKNTTRGIVG